MTKFLELPEPAADDRSARAASLRSRAAVQAKDKEAWLSIFADDAIVQDPVGVSPLDESGAGHRGKEAIAAFWDNVIAPNPPRMDLVASHAGGDEVANVLVITSTFPDGSRVSGEIVALYKVREDGLVVSLRAFWEFDKLVFAPAPTPQDEFLDALTRGAADQPESRALDPLVGDWTLSVAWEPMPGHGIRNFEQTATIRWILDGRVLESCVFDDSGTEVGKFYFAYDKSAGDYVAYALTSLSTFFALERGSFEEDGKVLRFTGLEGGDLVPYSIVYQRSIWFEGDDAFTIAITYPENPEGKYGPMHTAFSRVTPPRS